MIYLYTLPGTSFNMPQISVPLLKGYLKESKIESKQYDLSSDFLKLCFKKNYIKNISDEYYISLNNEEKNIVDNIDKSINELKNKNIDTYKIITASEQIIKYLEIVSRYFNIKWGKRDIEFSKKITTINDLLDFAYSKDNRLFDSVLVSKAKLNDNDIIYISVQYPFQLNYALRYSKILKSQNSKIKIILGGDYVTHINKNIPELMEKCAYIDGVTLFGNLDNVVQMIKMFQKDNILSIDNAIYRNGSDIVCNYSKSNSCILKERYVPDFSDLNLNNYLSNLKLIPLTLNYGCYHSKCNFCSRYYYYNGYSLYDIDKILAYLKFIYNSENIEAIYFVDECIPTNILIKLAKYLINNNINIKWMVETRIDNKFLNKEIAELLYKSGCREISFGIESYNNRILKDMNKGIKKSVAKKTMKNFYKAGISVSATFMIGYPTENIFNIKQTLNFIKRFKYLDTFGLSVFSYMRNSKLVNLSVSDEQQDLNLIYRTNSNNYLKYESIINRFNNTRKIKAFNSVKNNILYRSQYMYLDKKYYSLNYKGDDNMKIKLPFKKINPQDLKSKIYLKELKPEMTQCRVVQVDNKIKEKQND